MTSLELCIGHKRTGITVETDAKYPSMWRIRQGDRLSDMVNLSRAKDAALSWVRPDGSGGALGGGEVVNWRPSREARRASAVRKSEPVAP